MKLSQTLWVFLVNFNRYLRLVKTIRLIELHYCIYKVQTVAFNISQITHFIGSFLENFVLYHERFEINITILSHFISEKNDFFFSKVSHLFAKVKRYITQDCYIRERRTILKRKFCIILRKSRIYSLSNQMSTVCLKDPSILCKNENSEAKHSHGFSS